MHEIAVAVVDVGKADNAGWWRLVSSLEGELADEGAGGTSLEKFVSAVAADVVTGRMVALGFEAPLTVPVPDDEERLGRARRGQRDRPWPAGTAASSLGYAAQQVTWVLVKLGEKLAGNLPKVAWDPAALGAGIGSDESYYANFIVWEASLYGRAPAGSGPTEGARAAACEFAKRLAEGHVGSDVGLEARLWTPRGRPLRELDEPAIFNLAGAGLLRAGLATDLNVLSEQTWVVRVRRS